MIRFSVLFSLLLLVGCFAAGTDPEYIAETDAWHAERVARLATETGWLTLTGLHPLEDEVMTLGSAPDADVRLVEKAPARIGLLERHDGGLRLTADPAARLSVDGVAIEGSIDLRPDIPGPPTIVSVGDLRFHVIERGDKRFLRVKDTRHPRLAGFEGIERFPVEARWRVPARIEPFDPPRGVMVPNVLGQLEESPSPGELVFELAGRECRLTPIGAPGEDLFIIFADRTSGDATYGGGRFLSASAPDSDGRVVLDFNRAVNPPCVFSPFATCPLPPRGNILEVAVTAGEKVWGDH